MGSVSVLACEMMGHEVRAAMAEAGLDCPVQWVERELHNYPARLREELQTRLDALESDTVLLAFAQCGNAVAGLEARRSTLVLPRFADCVHLLRSVSPGDPGQVDMDTLYTFPGFLELRSGFFKEYDRCCLRYGPEKAQRICRMMVRHYRAVSLMDTGAVDPAPFAPTAEELAKLLGLACESCSGNYRVLTKLFSGAWDEEFVVVPRGSRLDEDVFFHHPQAQLL